MDEKKRALWYLGQYYAIPDGVSFDEFIYHAKNKGVETYRYSGLTPPEFVEGRTENTLLKVKYPDLALETEITLTTKKEREEAVSSLCPGSCGLCSKVIACKSTGYEKMSVGGTCFYGDCGNANEEFWFAENRETFWDNFRGKENLIAECIDNDESSKLQKHMRDLTDGFLPDIIFFGAKHDSKYVLMSSARIESMVVLLLYNIFSSAPEDIKERWEFYNYLNTEFFRYPQKRFRYNFKSRKMKYKLVPKEEPNGFDITIQFDGYDSMSEKRCELLKNAIYFYLCSIIGEEKILDNVLSMSIEENGDDWVDEEYFLKLVDLYSKPPEHYEGSVRSPLSLEAKDKYSSWLPFKSGVKNVITCCPDLTVGLMQKRKEENFYVENFAAKYAYLKLDYGIFDIIKKQKFNPVNFFLEINHNARGEFSHFIPIGYTTHDKMVCFDFIVLDGGKFFTFVSSLSPFLMRYNAKLVIVTSSSVTVCNCDRELTSSD